MNKISTLYRCTGRSFTNPTTTAGQAGVLQGDLNRMRGIVFNQINTVKNMHARLHDCVREVAINHDVLQNKVGSISDKIYLTIFAEGKGALAWVEQFYFESDMREDTAYDTMVSVCILGMGMPVMG